MVTLSQSFSSLQPFKALVIGDFMLDTYTTGRVKRISPEAPVPVLEVLKQESRPGGAGNVVLNLVTLGGQVLAVGRVGPDAGGQELRSRLSTADTTGLLIEEGYCTPVKNRLISDSQQLLRVDLETVVPLTPAYEKKAMDYLESVISTVQVVAISDYAKGFLTQTLLRFVIDLAKKNQIPVIVDPKGIDFTKYRGATMIKPNLSEAYSAAKLPSSAPLEEVAGVLLQATDVELLLITRSEAGISLFDRQGKRKDFPVRSKEVKDVTGAGDTVLATLCLALSSRIDITLATQLANIAAGISIERLGCVQVTLPELARRLLEFDAGTKIFDENHTYILRQVLKDRRYTLLVLHEGQKMSNVLFRTIRELTRKENSELIVYVQVSPENELIDILSSLQEVDFIIIQRESLEHLLEFMQPEEIFFLENEEKELLASLISHFGSVAKDPAKVTLIKD